ncbi:MAG: PEP-CTERM sorting domain-containing protein [Armatimonadota bacterium]
MIGVKGAAAIVAALSLASGAVAQEYRVEFLHPVDARWVWSTGRGISGGQMVGELHPVSHRGNGHAVVWNGDRNSWVDLHPKGALNSIALGVGRGIQVGRVQMPTDVFAAMWRGTPESLINLDVDGYDGTDAYATDGVYQVGTASTIQTTQAYVWQGSAESARNITPPGARNAGASDVHDGMVVGSAGFADGTSRALLWTMPTGSFVDLHPRGYAVSHADGVFGTEQVGYVRDPSTQWQRAALWHGTAESFVNLHPFSTEYQRSFAYATNGEVQVGEAWLTRGGRTDFHALAWRGSAETVVDLHEFLPDAFASSGANDIDEFCNIIGWADLDFGPTYAVVWRPVPEPGTLGAAGVGIALLVWRKAKREGRIKS